MTSFSAPKLSLVLKLLVPAAFFGYAVAANLSLAVSQTRLPGGDGLLSGRVTAEIDGLYRDNLPHKAPSVGVIGALRYVALGEGREGVVVGRDGHLFTAEEFSAPDPASYAQALDQVTRAASRLSDQGVQLVVAPLPAKADVLRGQLGDPAPALRQEELYRSFLADLARRGITAVDTRPALVGQAAPFLATDTHWTPAGARAVAEQIAASGAVARGEAQFVIAPEAPQRFAGDLVSYVTSDALARRVGLPPEEVAPYAAVAEAGADTDVGMGGGGLLDLFGETAAGLDLVGTSYSANPNWSFAEALKLALHSDVINHAEEGQGPFAPMTKYLSQLTPQNQPNTVIWEIPVRYLNNQKSIRTNI